MPDSDTAPGPGRSPAASTVGLKVGGMQKMLTSVEVCAAPSARLPAGAPVSVIVRAPPPPGPNPPGFRCSQSGNAASQSELEAHALAADPPAGHAGPVSPSKQ